MTHDLPLPDYDGLPLGSIESRVRTLDADAVARLREYEEQHANRAAVLQILDARAAALARGAQPSGGSPEARVVEVPKDAPQGQSAQSKQAPPAAPPTHGVPSSRGEPRRVPGRP